MKTQIIALESHDDLISVRDRMSWAKSRRILLVWPRFEKVALRSVDLRILQEHAHYLGADMGLVTRSGEIRRAAEGFGIPVFRSSAEAQRRSWPEQVVPSRRRRLEGRAGAESLRAMRDGLRGKTGGWKSGVVVRIGSFVVGVLAVLALAALFVPRATITLTPISQAKELTLPVKASTAVQEVAISGSVPAEVLSVTVTGSQSAPVRTMAAVAQGQATGIVEFKNLTQTAVVIPGGTIVYSVSPTAQRFATENEVQLSGKVDASIQVPIQAVQSGAGGNVPANSIQAVEGVLATSVSVTNPDPTGGGSDRTTTVPSADDRAKVRADLVAQLETQALDQMRGRIDAKDLLLPTTLKAGKVEDEAYDPAAGAPGTQVKVSLTMDFQAEYIKAADLKSLALAALAGSGPDGYVPSPTSLQFSLAGTPTTDQSGTTELDLQVQCRLVRELDLSRAAALVRGLPPSLADALLQSQLPLDRPPEVSLSPPWWPWLPLIPFRITVIAA